MRNYLEFPCLEKWARVGFGRDAHFESLHLFSDSRAESLVSSIIDAVFLLEQFPKLGRIVPDVNLESIRELLVQQYRVVYMHSTEGHVEVLAVRHSTRPLADF